MAKRKYNPEALEIGERIEIPRRAAQYAKQLAYTWRDRNPGKYFKAITVDGKTYIERITPKAANPRQQHGGQDGNKSEA
jgi:hypothetical protein